jgi:hypothetical protein
VGTPNEDPRADPDLAVFVAGGVAIGIAVCDERLRPYYARGFGPELSPDGRALRLAVTAPPGSEIRRLLEDGCRIAIGLSPPTVARAVQMKGVVQATAELGEHDRERMARHLDAFVAEAASVGMAEPLVRRFAAAVECVAVTCAIDEVYDQTPGPTAGKRR